MRTLKKTLSLVLVVAMVLGLCVVGASAKDAVENFTDDYQKVGAAYQEAMGVLVGVGIIDGMTETALEPQGTYTREQAAKIIAYMLLGKSKADSLKCTVAPFDDVAASRWSAGYIAFCVEQGIIDGMTATTYEPTGTLTGFQWAKMLLCAIGFGVKGEFTGSSWSVNTALVAHKVNLFAGDLDGADHTALRREQAALYAFNALKTAKVAYSPNVTSYVFGIQGYTTVNNIGTSLATDVFGLSKATGIVVDVEGMGAGYTVLSKDYNYKNATDKIKADNDIDMMYHAARIWYTTSGGVKTSVYTYDLAKTTTYKCQEITAGSKAADTAKATKNLTIGTGTDYEAYLIDNSAISAGSAYVTLKALYGSMGYVDAAKKTTSVVSGTTYTAPTANVRTDVSNIKYGAPVIAIYTTSTTETTTASTHGLYIYPVTSTTGVVKGYTQDAGKVVTVTLSDGTVLKRSVLANESGDREYYTVGNTYTFVLDSHGHVMYATKDYARTLWAYTGEWRATGNYGDINTDQGREYRFINVTTGEFAFYPVRFVDRNDDAYTDFGDFYVPRYGMYFDISATAGSDGRYVAELITADDNTYASGYVVVNQAEFKLGQNSEWYYDAKAQGGAKLFFNGETVTFLVATGTGANMKVNSYTGIAGLKEAYAVASNGMLKLTNAAFTVTKTQTDHWNASTIFVMAANLSTMSNYVFIPSDISSGGWKEVSGDVSNYFVTYGGAYLEGTEISVTFDASDINTIFTGGKLVRGFYTIEVEYDRNGNPVYDLTQKLDNAWNELCYYQNVSFADTMVNGTWLFYGDYKTFTATETGTKIVDLTSHGIASITDLFRYVKAHGENSVDIAFTVDPNTKTVDYVYVTNAGWDAQYNISLSAEMQAAGWRFLKGSDPTAANALSTSIALNDDAAWAASKAGKTPVTLYNSRFAKNDTTYTFTLGYHESNDKAEDVATTSVMNNGVVTAELKLLPLNNDNAKTWNYVVDELNNKEAIEFTIGSNDEGFDYNSIYEVESVKVPTGYTSTTAAGKFTFGVPVQVTLISKLNVEQNYITFTFENQFKDEADIKVTVPVTKGSDYQRITFTVYPMCSGTYELVSANYSIAPAAN